MIFRYSFFPFSVEFYALNVQDHQGQEEMKEHSFDGGITYSLIPNIQLDAYAGKGITENTYILMGAGISYRIPK